MNSRKNSKTGIKLGFILLPLALAAMVGCAQKSIAARPYSSSSSQLLSRNTAALHTAELQPANGYPGFGLLSSCNGDAQCLAGRLDSSFTVRVAPPFIVASNASAAELDRYVGHNIQPFANVLWNNYFKVRPNRSITILLLKDDSSYHYWAKTLYGDTQMSRYGYFKIYERTLLVNLSMEGGVLDHELTHALLDNDFPGAPVWFDEGMASLNEEYKLRDQQIVPVENWRLPILQRAIGTSRLRTLRQMMTSGDFYGGNEAENYAQARYFCMYLQSKGLLIAYYNYLRSNGASPNAAVRGVETICGKSVESVEADYLSYVRSLAFTPLVAKAN